MSRQDMFEERRSVASWETITERGSLPRYPSFPEESKAMAGRTLRVPPSLFPCHITSSLDHKQRQLESGGR